jgi:hypothetical protein
MSKKLIVEKINPYIHYLSLCAGGPIRSVRREVNQLGRKATICEGGEYIIACEPKRKKLSIYDSHRKRVIEHFAATGNAKVVTCPKCRESKYFPKED